MPRATAAKAGGALVLAAVDAAAAEMGLHAGLPLAQARAQVPSLEVEPADPDADAATLTRLARAADRYTPFVGIDPPDGLFLDISGCAHLFGGEAAMAEDVAARFARWGFGARLAVADGPAAAWGLARYGEGGVVPPGEALCALRRLPAEALRIPEETAAVLARLGLKTVEAVLRQPRAPLVQRFGPLIARRIDAAEGRLAEPITPLSPVPPHVAERRFAEPVTSLPAILASARSLAERLCAALRRQGEGARRLRLRMFHADGAVRETEMGASEPLAEPERIVALLAPRLEMLSQRIETESGVDLVRLYGEETGPLVIWQADWSGRNAALADLARLVDTLSERFGAAAVRRLVPTDTHQPAEAHASRPAQSAPPVPWEAVTVPTPRTGPDGAPVPPGRPLKMFAVPEPVETLASVPDGPPVRFVWRRAFYHVAAAEGPERISANWWDQKETGRTCDYFSVEDTEGRRFWMFRRGLYDRETDAPRWYVHGLFA